MSYQELDILFAVGTWIVLLFISTGRINKKCRRKSSKSNLYTHAKCTQEPLPSLYFRSIGKQTNWDGRFWTLIVWEIFEFSSAFAELNFAWQEAGIQCPLQRLCLFCRSTENQRLPPLTLIGCHIFDSSFEIAEQNFTKLDRKQVFKVICHIYPEPIRKNKDSWISVILTMFWISYSCLCGNQFNSIASTKWMPVRAIIHFIAELSYRIHWLYGFLSQYPKEHVT